MNLYERIINSLNFEMETPTPFGWFHLMCIGIMLISIVILYKKRKEYNEKQLKLVLGIYGIIALILEITKQVIWSFEYDPITNIGSWDYNWYAAPFQLCTTPIFVCIICLFLNKGKIRDSLLSYVSFITILGSIMTIILPESCFVSTTLVNIHTMWLHLGSFVVSVYLLFTKEVELKKENLKKAFIVFLIFVGIAMYLNLVIYNLGILKGETFNMFYISPYFTTHLPVYKTVQENVPYLLYLLFYIFTILLGEIVIYYIIYYYNILNKLIKRKKQN